MMFEHNGIGRHVLITGKPGCGKTTIVKGLVPDLLKFRPVGFYTEEIREGGVRRGFEIVGINGERRMLSHVGLKGELRVGKYGVDIVGFEGFLDKMPFFDTSHDLVIIDEIGKMECLSAKFRQLVEAILTGPQRMFATVPISGNAFIEKVKRRRDVILLAIERRNRDSARAEVLKLFAGWITQ